MIPSVIWRMAALRDYCCCWVYVCPLELEGCPKSALALSSLWMTYYYDFYCDGVVECE